MTDTALETIVCEAASRRYRRDIRESGAIPQEPGDITVLGECVVLTNVNGELARYRWVKLRALNRIRLTRV